MIDKTIWHTKQKNNNGIILFEVLLTVVILAIGITQCISGFSNIARITKRSREYFAAQYVAADFFFKSVALPETNNDLFAATRIAYDNTDTDISEGYMYTVETIPVESPAEEDEDNSLKITYDYKRVTNSVTYQGNTVFSYDTFFAKEEE